MQLLSEIIIVLAYIAAIGFFIFGIDDLIFDLHFIRHLSRNKNRRHITLEELRAKPEQFIAIFIPAWAEGGIVNRMADYALKILEYEHYDIFIGVYPNDPETNACVDALTKKFPRIHKAVCPDPGPTSKADCLNAIYRTMRLREIPGEREYSILALHDSEDIMHPLTLKIYNYYVPADFDMGQIPVFPLELPALTNWVGNSYMDEFAEMHLKDMFARQEMGGVVPSAGVGTAFNRAAIDYLADHNNGDPFIIGNLTEDYYIGIQLKRAGYRAGFINYPVDRVVVKRDVEGHVTARKVVTEIVAVREHFPSDFWSAVRQKSRWILGISMQCWELAGWGGTLPERYTLVRDRRAPFVHFINAIGYIVILAWVGEQIFRRMPWVQTDYWRPLYTADSILWSLILVDTALLLYRLAIKTYFVKEIYSWKQGFFSILRYPLANILNFCATIRALWMYIRSRFFGKQLVWLKTTHVFPTTADLTEFAASIEDLLLQDSRIPREKVEELLRSGSSDLAVPGNLLALRLLDEEQFTALWSRFSGLPERTVLEEDVDRDLVSLIPEDEAHRLRLMPVAADDEGNIEVAFLEPPSQTVLEAVGAQLQKPITACLITPTNMRILRERLYSERAMPRFRPAYNRAFEGLDPARHREVRTIQFRTGNRFSDLLLDKGYADADACRAMWCKIMDAEPCHMTEERLDPEAFEALGPLFCFLHRCAPLAGEKIVFQEAAHPDILPVIEQRLGWRPRHVTDRALPVRNFLRNVFGSLRPEDLLLNRLVERATISEAQAANLRTLKTLVRDPVHKLITDFRMTDREELHAAFADIARLPDANGTTAQTAPAGVLRPGFEEDTGARILEAEEGRVTIGLGALLAQQDFSHVCTRLMRCATRFVLIPPNK